MRKQQSKVKFDARKRESFVLEQRTYKEFCGRLYIICAPSGHQLEISLSVFFAHIYTHTHKHQGTQNVQGINVLVQSKKNHSPLFPEAIF